MPVEGEIEIPATQSEENASKGGFDAQAVAIYKPDTVGRIARLFESVSTLSASTWTLREARTHFSLVFRKAVDHHHPQRISKRGGGSVVVLDEADFQALLQTAPQDIEMVDYFRAVSRTDEPLAPLPRSRSREVRKL